MTHRELLRFELSAYTGLPAVAADTEKGLMGRAPHSMVASLGESWLYFFQINSIGVRETPSEMCPRTPRERECHPLYFYL